MRPKPGDEGSIDVRRVSLSEERTLLVRPTTAADVDGLVALYERLSDDDRYSRLFSLYRPNHAFFEHLVTVSERGGLGLVAVVATTADPTGRIVGEASYSMLPDGNGELRDHRRRGMAGMVGSVPSRCSAPRSS